VYTEPVLSGGVVSVVSVYLVRELLEVVVERFEEVFKEEG
jgi:hypothetical protein